MKQLNINEKQSTNYCISLPLRDEQIKINISKVKERLQPVEELNPEPIAIVCFAPSLNDTWAEIKKFKNIMTCSGAHKFLIERGIIPTYHVDLDPRPHKVTILGEPHKDVEYLIASTIHPGYLDKLKGFNVKLWHIFQNEKEGLILPRGEWCVTGGSSVGLRCFTLARFIGFTDFHIFGMDGSMWDNGTTHTTPHPKAPKEYFETEYEGKKYFTTPSMLHVAQETFKELNQMPDVKATFYGEGLVQHMARNYKAEHTHGNLIAFNKPELISKEYIDLNRKLHQDTPEYGMGGARHKDTVLKLMESLKTHSVLDYGAGKQMLAKSLDFAIFNYDPAIPEISASPNPADIVVCTDCLEHVEVDKLQFVLDDLKRCVRKIGYFVISTRPAAKTYANGQNTHLIQKGKDWWQSKLSKFFDVGTVIDKGAELHIVVGPKTKPEREAEKITEVSRNGTTAKFYTPNETTKWRAETLFTKEPSTIEWIEAMKPGAVLYDVGANIGGYSVLAGKKGVKVFAFEPEAENYNLLVKNLALNDIQPQAYCLALTDKIKAGELFTTVGGPGQSCHSFGEPNEYAQTQIKQGCISMPLDELVVMGLPAPDYIKIDVDGLEPLVVKGADHLLRNGITSMLVEVNTKSDAHLAMVEHLTELGFVYDEAQVKRAMRKEGTFEGVAEYIFTKYREIELHVMNRINQTKIEKRPFKYLYIENIFPEYTYKGIQYNMPDSYEEIEKTRGTKGYPKRFTATPTDEFWTDINKQLLSGVLKKALLEKFAIEDKDLKEDLLLIRDHPGYAIPPHTDSTSKVISALFYLPQAETSEGTSLFVPKKKGFTCKEGRHYEFKDFKKVKTMPFKPNSLFAFMRTDDSFHGVEPCSHERNVLLYNIKK